MGERETNPLPVVTVNDGVIDDEDEELIMELFEL